MLLSKGIQKKTRNFATRITIIYVLLGSLWILFSDKLMFILFEDKHSLNLVSTYKGWFYVLLTGWLLFSLVKRELKKRNAIEEQLVVAKEKAEESEKLKSAFLNNMSHEIRTPLNAILGFSELIVNPDLTTLQRKNFSAYIKRGTADLLDTIEDILIVSRIQVGQVKLEMTSDNVNHLLHGLVEYYSAQLSSLKIMKTLEIRFKSELQHNNGLIITDFRHLKQILNKLISNAVKFTDKGFIEVSCERINGTDLQFAIKDSGCGIPIEKQAIVFNPFRQVDEIQMNRKSEGTGLGLSIAKGLVELMKGRIWLESEVGKGSAFYFTIPYVTN
jgi:signal transduction histidine kinase